MYRRDFYLTVLIMAATMIQVWAFLVVLRTEQAAGTAHIALTITLISAGAAVLAGWGYVFRTSRNHVDRFERI
ncbi:MAG TPA: hypothetical protein VHV49_13495 [Pseudonocardiaceae bacterium]|nr:hypothetical protein [Pseudonocardiaceae bacterium]